MTHHKTQHDTHTHAAGFSLVELMLSIVVVVGFVGALLSLSIRQGTHRKVNLETSLATAAALDNLERMRNVPFATLPSLDGSDFDVPGIGGAGAGLSALESDPDGLPGELSVTVDKSFGAITLYRVVATVAWRGVNHSRRIQLSTLIAERK